MASKSYTGVDVMFVSFLHHLHNNRMSLFSDGLEGINTTDTDTVRHIVYLFETLEERYLEAV